MYKEKSQQNVLKGISNQNGRKVIFKQKINKGISKQNLHKRSSHRHEHEAERDDQHKACTMVRIIYIYGIPVIG